MAYSDTWNAAFEADPADSDAASGGASDIRDLKLAVRERMQADHYFDPAGTDADHGEHKQITFHAPISKPTAVANKSFLYGKDVSAKMELHWEDEDGNELQLTAAGALANRDVPSTEIIVFDKDTAVTGYTLQTDVDDQLLFITKGSAAGGETGAGAHSTGTWTQPSHELTLDEMPTHFHVTMHVFCNCAEGPPYDCNAQLGTSRADTTNLDTNSKGGSMAHNHGTTWRPKSRCMTRQQRN